MPTENRDLTMDKPSPPPEARLLRLVRTAAGIKAADAAVTVAARSMRGFSASRWSQIENGYEARDGQYKPVAANAATLAHMARAVGLPPERLETEGERPDAAIVLREMLAGEHLAPVQQESALSRVARDGDDADDDAAAMWPGPMTTEQAAAFRAIWGVAREADGAVAAEMAAAMWPGPMTAEMARAFRQMWRLKFISQLERVDLMRKFSKALRDSPAASVDADEQRGLGSALPLCPRNGCHPVQTVNH